MYRVFTTGDTATLSLMIHVSGDFAWPMTCEAWDSYAWNHLIIDNVFKYFGGAELSFFFISWIAFHCTEKFLMRGSHYMFPAVSGRLLQS